MLYERSEFPVSESNSLDAPENRIHEHDIFWIAGKERRFFFFLAVQGLVFNGEQTISVDVVEYHLLSWMRGNSDLIFTIIHKYISISQKRQIISFCISFLRSARAKTKYRYNGKYHAAACEQAFVCGTA